MLIATGGKMKSFHELKAGYSRRSEKANGVVP